MSQILQYDKSTLAQHREGVLAQSMFQVQIRIKELEKQIEDKRVDDGGWINKDND